MNEVGKDVMPLSNCRDVISRLSNVPTIHSYLNVKCNSIFHRIHVGKDNFSLKMLVAQCFTILDVKYKLLYSDCYTSKYFERGIIIVMGEFPFS